jgi:hypothetical protein
VILAEEKAARMNTDLSFRPHEGLFSFFAPTMAALLVTTVGNIKADQTNSVALANGAPAPTEKPTPLPIHQIGGSGGVFVTLSAYIVNPPRNGEPVGRPAVGFSFAKLGHGENLEAPTISESPFKRLELSYGWDRFDLGDLPQALRNAGLVNYHQQEVQLHNFNARLQILREDEFDQKWIPALTFGAHYKYNDGISEVNNQVFGLLASHGITRNHGLDYTLYASKMFTQLPVPVLLQLGGRATEGVWEGLGGFTDSYNFELEGNAVVFLSHSLALAGEYKQQPTDYRPIGSLVQKADDWFTLDAVFILNKHMTLAAGYAHFGKMLNHRDNGVWGITTKWEF